MPSVSGVVSGVGARRSLVMSGKPPCCGKNSQTDEMKQNQKLSEGDMVLQTFDSMSMTC